jgi:peptidyl-prolyl cis-trans isomerase D
MDEFNKKASGVKSVDEVASKLGITAITHDNLMPLSNNVNGVGNDPIVIGTVTGMKKGALSRPTIGEAGVFVVAVNNISLHDKVKTVAEQQKETEQMLSGRTDYEVFNALKEMADVDFHKSRID